MSGKTELTHLLNEMEPVLHSGEYVFVSIERSVPFDLEEIIASFIEEEGTTFILSQKKADALHLDYDYVASWITLNVHSSLEAVGLTAAISTALAQADISCNVVAAYYHDHIFVAQKEAQAAMQVLTNLMNTKRETP
ncbi:MAG: ACT domain-containing protein [Bacteroidota bacterium]